MFQEGLAMVVQDPLLCDLPIQVRAVRGPSGRGRTPECRWGLRPEALGRRLRA